MAQSHRSQLRSSCDARAAQAGCDGQAHLVGIVRRDPLPVLEPALNLNGKLPAPVDKVRVVPVRSGAVGCDAEEREEGLAVSSRLSVRLLHPRPPGRTVSYKLEMMLTQQSPSLGRGYVRQTCPEREEGPDGRDSQPELAISGREGGVQVELDSDSPCRSPQVGSRR